MTTGQELAKSFLDHGAFGIPNKLEAMTAAVADARDNVVYADLLHELAKQGLFEVFLLLNGEVDIPEGKSRQSLPFRLTVDQRETVREAFAIIWDVIAHKELERTPFAAARADQHFAQFMRTTLAPRKPGSLRRGSR